MNKFLSLMKITLIEDFNLNKIFKKEKVISKVLVGFLLLALYALIAFYMGMMLHGFGSMITDGTEGRLVLSLGLLVTSFILILTTLTRANAYLFKAKDFDLLSSLSIPLSTIVVTKISSLLIFSYLTISVIYIPTIVVFMIFTSFKVTTLLLSILLFILMPLLIIAVFSVVSYLFSILLSKFRYKNVLTIIFSLIGFIGIMVLSFSSGMTNDEQVITNFLVQLDKMLKYLYYPAFLMVEVLTGNLISLLYISLMTLLPFVIFIYYTSKVYVYVNTSLISNRSNKKFSEKNIDSKTNGRTLSLFKIELKKFFSIPLYVINSLAGKLLMVIMIILLLFTSQMKELVELAQGDFLVLIILGVMMFVGGITTTSATISLEGKNFWILKSLPVTEKQIFISKLAIDIIFSLIAGLVSSILVFIVLKPSIIVGLLFMLIIIVFSFNVAITGLLVNLRFYRLDWDLPVKVIKQGTSVILLMLIDFVATIILIILTVLALNFITSNVALIMLMIFIIMIASLAVLLILLNKLGTKWFNQIKAN